MVAAVTVPDASGAVAVHGFVVGASPKHAHQVSPAAAVEAVPSRVAVNPLAVEVSRAVASMVTVTAIGVEAVPVVAPVETSKRTAW